MTNTCCDVCEMSEQQEMVDCQEEISVVLKTVQEIPESGERKVGVTMCVHSQCATDTCPLDFRVDSWIQ